jgi:hypothetical protein
VFASVSVDAIDPTLDLVLAQAAIVVTPSILPRALERLALVREVGEEGAPLLRDADVVVLHLDHDLTRQEGEPLIERVGLVSLWEH